MGETLIALFIIVIVVLVCLWLIGKLGVEPGLARILQIAVVGIALIIIVVRYLLPLM